MRANTPHSVSLLGAAAALVVLCVAPARADTPQPPHLALSTKASGITTLPADTVLRTTTDAAKNGASTGRAEKRLFKDLRLGSCRSTPSIAPPSSWPARGDAAVSVCRP